MEGSKKLRGKKRKEGIVSDFPGGRVGSTPGFDSGSGKISLAAEQLSLYTTTAEATSHNY